ncbi:hypothetical protein MP228_003847 [Amoeboaphelidium protococcarum]|nr:hypothetical protein MP228_003847 [Amoeboaphelidium protococcarum]
MHKQLKADTWKDVINESLHRNNTSTSTHLASQQQVVAETNSVEAQLSYEIPIYDMMNEESMEELFDAQSDQVEHLSNTEYQVPIGGQDAVLAQQMFQLDMQDMADQINVDYQQVQSEQDAFYPFKSQYEYKWASTLVNAGHSKKDVNDIIKLCEEGGLSVGFRNYDEMTNLIDQIPQDFDYTEHQLQHDSKIYKLYSASIEKCIRLIFEDIDLCRVMHLSPHVRQEESLGRIYSDLYDTQWWIDAQSQVPEDHVIVPIIINSDATQLNKSGRVKAHPVYLTIGNLPRKIRASANLLGMKLLGILPVVESSDFQNPDDYRQMKRVLYQQSMSILLQELNLLYSNGLQVVDALGRALILRPLLAMYSGDYEEIAQRVCLLKAGKACPTCLTPSTDFYKYYEHSQTRQRSAVDHQQYTDIHHDCRNFFFTLSNVDIYQCIPPDELHGICQGVFVHLFNGFRQWLLDNFKLSQRDQIMQQINQAFADLSAMDINRVFRNGIFKLQNTTARENLLLLRELPIVLIMVMPLFVKQSNKWLPYVDPFILLAKWVTMVSSRTSSDQYLIASQIVLKKFFQSSLVYFEMRQIYKLHSLLHYVHFIKKYGCIQGMTTTNHRDQFKQILQRLIRLYKLETIERGMNTRVIAQGIDECTYVGLSSKGGEDWFRQINKLSGIKGLFDIITQSVEVSKQALDNKVQIFRTVERHFTVPGDDAQRKEYIRYSSSFYGNSVNDFVALYKSYDSEELELGKFLVAVKLHNDVDLIICQKLMQSNSPQGLSIPFYKLSDTIFVRSSSLLLKKIQVCKVEDKYVVNPFSDQLSFCYFAF